MNYNEFKDALVSKVKEQLGASYSVALNTVFKNNGISLDAIIIKNKDFNISPTLYINHLFNSFENGSSLEEIASHLIELNEKYQVESNFDIEQYIDFENAKENIVYKLINYEKNKELLSDSPFIDFLDLAIVFYYKVDSDYMPDGYIKVTYDVLKKWGISIAELYNIAKENTIRIYKVKVTKVFDLIYDRLTDEEKKIFSIEENIPLYVLSNEDTFNGANCLLDNDTLCALSEMYESNLYIIPSSIHETLFIPEKDNTLDIDYMTAMVRSVNMYELPEHEYLSDHIYFYSREDKKLTIAG